MRKKFKEAFAEISWLTLASVILLVVVLDQVTKFHVLRSFSYGSLHPVIPGFFNLTLHFNPGAAFGLFADLSDGTRQLALGILSKFAILVVLYLLVAEFSKNRTAQIAIGLILGGAIGNIIDRLRFGEVVDFLDFYINGYHWPAFNIADSCICVGVGVLLLCSPTTRVPAVVQSKSEAPPHISQR